jgi:hypothetical protein
LGHDSAFSAATGNRSRKLHAKFELVETQHERTASVWSTTKHLRDYRAEGWILILAIDLRVNDKLHAPLLPTGSFTMQTAH